MPEEFYKPTYDIHDQGGIVLECRTVGTYIPAHWHNSVEIVYMLNGNATVFLEGTEYRVVPGEFLVIDTKQIHEYRCTHTYMMLIIRVEDDLIQSLMGNKRDFRFLCSREELTKELVTPYLEIADKLKELTRLFLQRGKGFRLGCNSIVLDVMYRLVLNFSFPLYKDDLPEPSRNQLRTKEIIEYIDQHYAEPLSLEQIAEQFGLNSDYFSRMFRKNVGIPFTQHINYVRLTHIYHDICSTDNPIMEILDKHGFTNYKLFSRMFKELYGETPRDVRRRARADHEEK